MLSCGNLLVTSLVWTLSFHEHQVYLKLPYLAWFLYSDCQDELLQQCGICWANVVVLSGWKSHI